MSTAAAEVTTDAATTAKTTVTPEDKLYDQTKVVETKTETDPKEEPAKTLPEQKKVDANALTLKLPENSLLKPEHVEKITSYAKEKGLTQEQAQTILERESNAVAEFDTAQKSQISQIKEGWVTEAKADKEIGGEAFSMNLELAKRVVDTHFTPAFKKALDETGLGNNPELIRGLVRIGKAMHPREFVSGAPASATSQKKSMEDVFYSESTSKQKG